MYMRRLIKVIMLTHINKKICHITSAHSRYDIRIYMKMCNTLSLHGCNVSLIVADGLADEISDGIKIYGVEKKRRRIDRMLIAPKLLYKKALNLNAHIYHLHDPELFFIGLKLKRKGKKVIFDSHEDYPMQILSKPYFNGHIAKIISNVYKIVEKIVLVKFDVIITATPYIKEKISEWHHCVIDINNYPLLSEFHNNKYVLENDYKKDTICYIGGISLIRGIKEIIIAMEHCSYNIRLILAGEFSPLSLKNEIIKYEGWKKIDEMGFINRKKILEIFNQAFAGIITYMPLPNHINAQPNKLFEYMSAELPVIASNFPLWKEIIEKNQCGICVDPCKPEEIASAIEWLASNKEKAIEMGKNGRRAVLEKYNWDIEKKKLLSVYTTL